jgi:hypothetical protein
MKLRHLFVLTSIIAIASLAWAQAGGGNQHTDPLSWLGSTAAGGAIVLAYAREVLRREVQAGISKHVDDWHNPT